MSEASVGTQYDRWLSSRSISGRGYAFLASVPGSVLVNTPVFGLDKNLILKPEHRLLDIGCGSGSLLRVVASRVAFERSPVGIDVSHSMLGRARREVGREGGQISLAAGAGTRMPFANGVFDIATCS
ncbi:MAG TPA: class I SAM-dependent methyltransferase, partial [Dehalococcoidia bacterium]